MEWYFVDIEEIAVCWYRIAKYDGHGLVSARNCVAVAGVALCATRF